MRVLSVTKQKILNSAMRFFLEKGYLATSIQNIADDCGVAKGSLYNFFSSKEDILIEILLSQQESMIERKEQIQSDKSLSSKEIFIRETECQCEFFLNNNYMMQEMKKFSTPDGKVAPILFQMRASLLKSNIESLIRVLGEGIRSNVWDLVFIYNGIIREIIFLMVFEKRSLILRDVAEFIVHCMEDMAANTQAASRPPLLKREDMEVYMQSALQGESFCTRHRLPDLLNDLMTTIPELQITNFKKAELQEAAELLQEALQAKQHKPVLIRSLIGFMEKEHGLRHVLKQIEKLVFEG